MFLAADLCSKVVENIWLNLLGRLGPMQAEYDTTTETGLLV